MKAHLLIRQTEGVDNIHRRHRNELLPIHGIRHRSGSDGRTEIRLPQQFAVARIESNELAVAAAGEQRRRMQWSDTPPSVDGADQPEIPGLVASLRIDGANGAVHIVAALSASRERTGRIPGRHGIPAELSPFQYVDGTVLPGGDIKQTGTRTERRVVPIGAALIAGIHERAFLGWIQDLNRPALWHRSRWPSSP